MRKNKRRSKHDGNLSVHERTLEVIQFLNKERLASYKEIAKELGYQERMIFEMHSG